MRSTVSILAAVAIVLAACGAGEQAAVTTTETLPSTTTNVAATPTTVPPPATTMAAETTATQPIDVSFGADFVAGPEQIPVSVGDELSVWVLSADEDAEIHVHGYDLFFDAPAGVPVEVTFTADVPGIFEVEIEGSHKLLFELVVTG